MFVAAVALWVRSHWVRDYDWAWLQWTDDAYRTAQGAAAEARWLKVDVNSGGGQLEVAWRAWPDAERERLRKFDDPARHDVYHRVFREVGGPHTEGAVKSLAVFGRPSLLPRIENPCHATRNS